MHQLAFDWIYGQSRPSCFKRAQTTTDRQATAGRNTKSIESSGDSLLTIEYGKIYSIGPYFDALRSESARFY